MLKIAIVDDEQESIDLLKTYIKQFCDAKGMEYELFVCYDGKELVRSYKKKYDIIFLDIEMKDLDGISAARQIRKKDQDTIIVFVTQMAQYAIRGYEVEALDYVVKPVEYYSFELVFRKILKHLKRKSAQDIVINYRDTIRILPQSEICYIEVLDHYITYHMTNESVTVKGTLGDVEKKLDGMMFYRCNRCYLVNLGKITEIDRDGITVGGKKIEVSRSRKKGLIKAVTEYLGGGI